MKNQFYLFFSLKHLFILLILCTLLLTNLNAQTITEKDINSFINETKKVDNISQALQSHEEIVETKTAFVNILQKRLDAELKKPTSRESIRRISLFAFELFTAEARLSAEKLKLWRLNKIISMLSKIDSKDAEQSIIQCLKGRNGVRSQY